jgi:elongation factor Ts
MTSAVDIKAADVQKLRLTTGAGLMDCKHALVESKGDMEQAIRALREKGIAKSSKRADRATSEGLVEAWVSPSGKDGLILEVNSETDFVARNDEFAALLKHYLELLEKNPVWDAIDHLPKDRAEALSAKVGEKIAARRFARYKAQAGGVVAAYIHAGAKLGVLVQIDADKEQAVSDDLKNLGREIALQIAGANPLYISSSDVPADIVQGEKDIVKKQMEGQNKPAEMLEKIATGKLQQFYQANCLLEQPHVKDTTGKLKIKDLIANVGTKTGLNLKVARFVRYRVGSD